MELCHWIKLDIVCLCWQPTMEVIQSPISICCNKVWQPFFLFVQKCCVLTNNRWVCGAFASCYSTAQCEVEAQTMLKWIETSIQSNDNSLRMCVVIFPYFYLYPDGGTILFIYNVEITAMMWYSWVYVCEAICFLQFGVLSTFAHLLFTWKLVILNEVYFKLPRKMSRMLRGAALPIGLYKTCDVCLYQPKKNTQFSPGISFLNRTLKHRFSLPASKKTFSSCICIAQKTQCHLLACAHKIYFLSRPSPGWGDCGGSCTLFGSMSEVYTLGSSCWNGRQTPLDKLQRTSTSPRELIMHRKRRRSCPSSHPLWRCPPALQGHFYLCALPQVYL